MDDDLNAIRQLSEFKELIEQYKNIFELEIAENIADDAT